MSYYDTLSYTYDNLSINKQLYTYENRMLILINIDNNNVNS